MSSLVSIIVPIYNVECYIERCVQSLLSQTYPLLDIILVNDGSTDTSGEIIDQLQLKDKRIKVIHSPNNGVTAARRMGWQASSGEFCLFVDGDDFLVKDAIEYFLSIFSTEECDFISAWYDLVYESGKNVSVLPYSFNGRFKTIDYIDKVVKEVGVFSSIWIGMFRRNIIDQKVFDIDRSIYRGEDATALIGILNNCNYVVVTDKVFYHYFQRSSSVTHTQPISPHYIITLYELQYSRLKDEYKSHFLYVYFQQLLRYYYEIIINEGYSEDCYKLQNKLRQISHNIIFSELDVLNKVRIIGLQNKYLSLVLSYIIHWQRNLRSK